MLPDSNDPSYVGALIYFNEAAARLSFSEAAAALGVTPSAVSHRVTALEEALGKRLFEREIRRVRLTEDGAELAAATTAIWAELQGITDRLSNRTVLRVSVGPYLSATWLMPRLGLFEEAHPGLRIDLSHRIGPPDPKSVDVMILWADMAQPPAGGELLFSTDSIPVAAPNVLDVAPFWQSPLPPIHYRDRQAWRHWLRAAGGPESYADRGEVLQDPSLVLEAAAHGRGLAIGFLPFIDTLTAQDRLVPAHERAVPADRGYWIAQVSPGNSLARRFVAWVKQQ